MTVLMVVLSNDNMSVSSKESSVPLIFLDIFGSESKLSMAADFTAADANSDGLLDAAEYVTYYNSALAEKTAAGEWTDPTEDRAAIQYALMNRVNEAQDGITYDDVKAFIAASMPKMAELRAAEGL